MHILKTILSVACLGLLSACASYQSAGNAVHHELVAPYRLDSGDRLRVIVYGQSDLSNTFTIDQAGRIAVPLIGTVAARGRTTAEIGDDIAAKLRAGFVRRPDVSVEVDRYRPFFATGEVTAAGQYPYVAGLTVQSAIAVAGGFTPRADQYTVDVTRSYNGRIETARLTLTDPIMPGDTITVRERLF
jgi:polysaccharide export outer membrane protein